MKKQLLLSFAMSLVVSVGLSSNVHAAGVHAPDADMQAALEASRASYEAEQAAATAAGEQADLERVLAESAAEHAAAQRAEEAEFMAAIAASTAVAKPKLTAPRLAALSADIRAAVSSGNLRTMRAERVKLVTTIDAHETTAEQHEQLAILMTTIDPAIKTAMRHKRLGAERVARLAAERRAASRATAGAGGGGGSATASSSPAPSSAAAAAAAAAPSAEAPAPSVQDLIARFGGGR